MSSKAKKAKTEIERQMEMESARIFGKHVSREKAVVLYAVTLAACAMPMVMGLRLWSRLRRKAEAAAAARQGDGEPLADRLCRLRLARGLSQEEAAAALGVPRRTVCRWESGAAVPDEAQRRALAALYGAAPEKLQG